MLLPKIVFNNIHTKNIVKCNRKTLAFLDHNNLYVALKTLFLTYIFNIFFLLYFKPLK